MNKTGCIHPEILSALSRCGHGDQILIADGNFPLASKCPHATLVYLAVSPGIPLVTDVLKAVLAEVTVEAAFVMQPDSGEMPEIFAEFKKLLPDTPFEALGRHPFYQAAANHSVVLAISTGEKRIYANILLTIGVS